MVGFGQVVPHDAQLAATGQWCRARPARHFEHRIQILQALGQTAALDRRVVHAPLELLERSHSRKAVHCADQSPSPAARRLGPALDFAIVLAQTPLQVVGNADIGAIFRAHNVAEPLAHFLL